MDAAMEAAEQAHHGWLQTSGPTTLSGSRVPTRCCGARGAEVFRSRAQDPEMRRPQFWRSGQSMCRAGAGQRRSRADRACPKRACR